MTGTPASAANLGGILHHRHWHLKLHQHHIGCAYLFGRTVDVLAAESPYSLPMPRR